MLEYSTTIPNPPRYPCFKRQASMLCTEELDKLPLQNGHCD